MSGLLNRARDIRDHHHGDVPGHSQYNASLEIEEFDDPTVLKISNEILGTAHGGFSARQFTAAVKTIEDGVELPARFFEIMSAHLHFSTGALLLLDREAGVFAPWVSAGLDKTTTHRFRLSGEIIENFQSGLSQPLFYHDSELEPFRQYFSIRLFDQLETLIICPFYLDEKLFGILLIINSEEALDQNMMNALETVSSEGSSLLGSSRFLNLSGTTQHTEPVQPDEIFARIDSSIELILSTNRKLSLILLDLQNILSFLSEKNSHIDIFRVQKDIFTILDSMVGGIGEVINLDNTRTLLLLSSKTAIKDQILINQIQLSLKSFFQHRDDFPLLQAKIRRIPEDGMEAKTLLENLV